MANPVAMRIPFGVAPDGGIAIETDPDRQIAQRVRGLIGTEPGQRVMNVRMGLSLASMLFEPGDDLIQAELIHDVTDLLAGYEPGVVVLSVLPVVNSIGDGLAGLEVDFTRTEHPSTPTRLAQSINTAIIEVGGSVSEVIRG